MLIEALHKIDWQQPWLTAFDQLGQTICDEILSAVNPEQALLPVLNNYAQRLYNAQNLPIHFVAQNHLPKGMAYELFIYNYGTIPTRANLHDFFNALIWLRYPQIKAAFNQLQAQTITKYGIGPTRQRIRDLITLFDENGLFLVTRNFNLTQAITTRDWQSLFIDQRQQWHQHVSVIPFGHALLEKLFNPFKAITAHTFIYIADQFDAIKACHQLINHIETNQRFLPLPVMGIPGWCSDNQQIDFYQDPYVFRS